MCGVNKKYLGQYLKELRRQRGWTQKELAEKTWALTEAKTGSLSIKQIQDLEQGRKTHIIPKVHLWPLVRAFQLIDAEAIELYRRADSHYPERKKKGSLKYLERLLGRIQYPANVKTRLWDFVMFNAYHFELWGYTNELFDALNDRKDPLNPNLLRILFDPSIDKEIHVKSRMGGEDMWHKETICSLRSFRAATAEYITTGRYRQIIKGANDRYFSIFGPIWDLSRHKFKDSSPISEPPAIATVDHPDPDIGRMYFLALRLPAKVSGHDLDATIYMPMVESEESYRKLRASVEMKLSTKELKEIYCFIERDLE